jgi:Fe2+ transport system protein FeoA
MSGIAAGSQAAHGRAARAIRLSDLRVGAAAHLLKTPLDVELTHLLRAIGLTLSSRFRLCQNGDPCIVQVRSTRIGLSRAVAAQIQVVPIADEGL